MRERRHALEAAAAALASWIVRRLPRRLVLALGRRLGRLWAVLDRRHLAIAEDNLRAAFPDWDAARVAATARGVYAHFGAVILDLLWMEGRPVQELLALADLEGIEHLQHARAAGRGIVAPSAHLGNWEVQAVASVPHVGPIAVVARPLENPALDRRLVALRASTGNTVIYKQKALARVLGTIRDGGIVAILIDQNVQAKDGIFVRFFGRPACTTTVAAALALKTGCAIVPVRCLLQPNGRYRMVYGPLVEWPRGGRRDQDVEALTQHLTSIVEGWVRETPEQWLWLHRRWKTRPSPSLETSSAPGLEGSLVSSRTGPAISGSVPDSVRSGAPGSDPASISSSASGSTPGSPPGPARGGGA
jgi:KDO2-lipid IV(A) lauroyltransferase